NPWRTNGNLTADTLARRICLSRADVSSKGSVGLRAELSRKRRVRVSLSRVERAEFGRGRYVGRDERCRLPNCQRNGRRQPNGGDGVVRGWVHLLVFDHAHGSL